MDRRLENRYYLPMRIGIDYIGIGVGAVITKSDGTILLAKRGKEARNERLLWEFPGRQR